MLKEEMDACQATPSLTQSRTLKQMSQAGYADSRISSLPAHRGKANQRQKFFLNQEDVQRYFPKHYTPQQMQQVIHHLLPYLAAQTRLQQGHAGTLKEAHHETDLHRDQRLSDSRSGSP